MIKPETIERFQTVLREEGMKFTPQRLSILNEVLGNDDHRECEEIYLSLKEGGEKISRATIYRTMDILVKYNFARKMDIGDGRLRYEKKEGHAHHDHMICVQCGNIIEFVDDEIENRQDIICKDNNFKLIRHIHQLYGICKSCQ